MQISHNLGNTTTATASATATVVTLGQDVQRGLTGDIGFWHSKNGQALINGFNGGSNATALSSWLAATFPNLYGAGNGSGNNLTGQTNAQVAAFYKSQFALPGSNVEAQVLATALNVYATTLVAGRHDRAGVRLHRFGRRPGGRLLQRRRRWRGLRRGQENHAERVRAAEGGGPAGRPRRALQRRHDPSEEGQPPVPRLNTAGSIS